MKHFSVVFEPGRKQVYVHAGATLAEAAGLAGIILNSVCGGKGTCRKCVVLLGPDSGEVLACQYRVTGDLTVTIPATSKFYGQKILTDGVRGTQNIVADIYKRYVDVGSATNPIFGVAVDLGTTTVVAKLIDMKTGSCIATEAAFNPQIRFGDDVISRINYAQTEGGLDELHNVAIACLNDLIGRLCRQASIKASCICELCLVGNTVMNHIFLKFPVKQLGQAPYSAFSLEARDLHPSEVGLVMNPSGSIHTVANVAGFVGSDIVAVGLAVGISEAKEPTLVIDVGTNGELLLTHGDRLYAASCAAGPALEGARIGCGSRATDGAVEAVLANKVDVDVDVIGSCRPKSICGSGLIDAVAVLVELGIVDLTGRFVNPVVLQGKLSSRIFSRIVQKDSQRSFLLCGREDDAEQDVFLTQADIRQVQLAKAAIRAGVKILEQKLGLTDKDLKCVFLAGAFGSFIRAQSALRIGLLPDVPPESIFSVGNAAGSGAEMVLLSSRLRDKARQLACDIEYVEIASEPNFANVYADSMVFDPAC